MALIEFSENGLYCAMGNFFIDPWKPVGKAVITHAHSDHARAGSDQYLCHRLTRPLLEERLGAHKMETLEWGETISVNGVKLSLHPAGHVIGSSQVRVEYGGEVWVVSGDYKVEDDGISGTFESVRCHTFITESTFGLPIYRWDKQERIYRDIREWVLRNHQSGVTSVLLAYSLGKAQRILPPLTETGLPVFVHGSIYSMQEALLQAGCQLPEVKKIDAKTPPHVVKGNILIAPPGSDGGPWLNAFSPYSVGVCSGWMQVRNGWRNRTADSGFALSDHADWDGLISAVKATGASKVFVTHGFQRVFSRWLNENGIESAEVKTEYSAGEEEQDIETKNEQPE